MAPQGAPRTVTGAAFFISAAGWGCGKRGKQPAACPPAAAGGGQSSRAVCGDMRMRTCGDASGCAQAHARAVCRAVGSSRGNPPVRAAGLEPAKAGRGYRILHPVFVWQVQAQIATWALGWDTALAAKPRAP